MLVNIGEIKDKLGVLTTISSNVSSILSKVNNLGSQKTYKLSFASLVTAYSPVNLTGAGLLVVSNINGGIISCTVGGQSFQIPKESVIAIPIGSSAQFNHNSTGYSVYVIWCPLS